jgi:phosphatidylserine/phosphatidylglycerophosphate/cardiolipin synthase-like enzyme
MRWFVFLFLLLPLHVFAGEDDALIVCENSIETMNWNLELIDNANYSIDLELYSTGGDIFCTFMEHIEKRIQERPQLQAHIACFTILLHEKEKSLVWRLKTLYPKNFHFQETYNVCIGFPDYITAESHLKCLIVDEHFFSIGGTNFHDCLCSEGTTTKVVPNRGELKIHYSMPSGARDMDIVGRGPVAKKLRQMFYRIYSVWQHYERTGYYDGDLENFKANALYFSLDKCPTPYIPSFEHHPKLVVGAKIKLCISGNMDSPNKITTDYAKLIDTAKKEIFIGNLFFTPAPEIFKALIRAANRGVEIHIITNGVWEKAPFFTQFFAWANRTNYAPILYGREFTVWDTWLMGDYPLMNTHIYEYQVSDVVYHKKVMVVDNRYTVVGSYNFSAKSDRGDYEGVLIVDSSETAKQTLDVLKRDRQFSREINPEEAQEWYNATTSSYVGYVQRLFHGLM